MSFLYQISIFLYSISLKVLSFFGHKKAKLFVQGRKQQEGQIRQFQRDDSKQLYWFHCASLGEFEQGKPLMEFYKSQGAENQILITFFSPSGYEIKKNEPLADYVFYLPLDTKQKATNFIKTIKPDRAFFIKYEIWPNYFTELKKARVPLYMISSTFRENQIYFKSYGKWFLEKLKAVSYFFVQDEQSKTILNQYGFENAIQTGDTRYDNVLSSSKNAQINNRIKEFTEGQFTIIMGSSWPEEEKMMAQILVEFPDNYRLIIVPHDVSESHIKQIETLFSKGKPHRFSDESTINSQVLIIDSIGFLRDAYQHGSIAFVGGGFKNSLHNVLEPAVFGLPVIFGNNHEKYHEADLMIKAGVGFNVSDVNDLKSQINRMSNSKELFELKEKTKNFVQSNLGATKKILEKLKEIESV